MDHFAGLDVSVKETSVCIVDDTGRIVREVKVASEPEALRPVLTFKNKTTAWCRQYELRYAAKQASHGLACRSQGGRWEVVAATPPAAVGPRPAGSGPRQAIDDLVTAMMIDQPLSRSDEAATIGKGWSHL